MSCFSCPRFYVAYTIASESTINLAFIHATYASICASTAWLIDAVRPSRRTKPRTLLHQSRKRCCCESSLAIRYAMLRRGNETRRRTRNCRKSSVGCVDKRIGASDEYPLRCVISIATQQCEKTNDTPPWGMPLTKTFGLPYEEL